MKYCNSCYFSNPQSMFCHKGYPHWAFRKSCDKYYEIRINYGPVITTTAPLSNSFTTTSNGTISLSDKYVDDYFKENSKCDTTE